ncbi:hypothetical protein BC941DRAFT_246948 [Chlamydoabsidia padenii]|nr:hypothetical protein BC941DRAFT_246948 [Chlamydoabsidia padenii]
MFRPNPGVDLNDFPVLGTPPSSSGRGGAMTPTISPSSSMLPNSNGGNNNRTSYASTAGGPFSNGPYNQQQQQPQNGGYQQDSLPASASGRPNMGNAGSLVGQRTFSMDDFPALRSNDGSYMKPRQEPWGNEFGETGGLSSSIPLINGSSKHIGTKNDSLASSQWAQGRSNVAQLQRNGRDIEQDGSAITSSPPQGTDPYGLLGLLGVIRMTDPDRSMLALGSDLTTLGLDLNTADSIYSTFISPWSDTQTPQGLHVEPGYYLPSCYRNVQASPTAHQRMRTFSDEILFYVFYCMPKDISQEAAAQELYARNWRYHKELGLWLTKETDENGRPVQVFRRTSANSVDRGIYIFFDPTTWQKVKREWTLSWDSIEDRHQHQGGPTSSASSQTGLSNPPPPPPPGSAMSNPNHGVMI